MSSLSQFTDSSRPPKVLFNKFSTAGAAGALVTNTTGKTSITGTLTANALVTALSHTGSGVISYFACYGTDATSRTHRVKITIDGTVVFDATSAAVASANTGVVAIGIGSAGGFYAGDPIPYNTSLLVEYASSLGETGLTTFAYTYRTN